MIEIFSRHHLFRVIDLAEYMQNTTNQTLGTQRLTQRNSKKIHQWIPSKFGLISLGRKKFDCQESLKGRIMTVKKKTSLPRVSMSMKMFFTRRTKTL